MPIFLAAFLGHAGKKAGMAGLEAHSTKGGMAVRAFVKSRGRPGNKKADQEVRPTEETVVRAPRTRPLRERLKSVTLAFK
jgi:hypothetical protein